jgi:hypothetical protein
MDDPVLRSSRREAAVALGFFALTLVVTIAVCARFGYGRAPGSLTFVLGVPDWIFWGILVPWAGCLAFGTWFGFRFMRDEDLGSEAEGKDDLDG